jgi:hypothetical protein
VSNRGDNATVHFRERSDATTHPQGDAIPLRHNRPAAAHARHRAVNKAQTSRERLNELRGWATLCCF